MTTTARGTTHTLWIGAQPDPNDRLQIDVSEVDYNRIPWRGTMGSVTVTDLRTSKQLTVRRTSCDISDCLCALELVAWADETQPEQALSEQRYGFVVITGRHKILDYHKPDGQQIATADDEESARAIVRALNAAESHTSLVAALEQVRKMSQYIVNMPDRTTLYCAKMQAEQIIIEANDALSRVRG